MLVILWAFLLIIVITYFLGNFEFLIAEESEHIELTILNYYVLAPLQFLEL